EIDRRSVAGAVRDHEIDHAFADLEERPTWPLLVDELEQRLDLIGEDDATHLALQRLPVGEMSVQRRDADAGLGRDGLQRQRDTAASGPAGDLEDEVVVARRVASPTSRLLHLVSPSF